MYTVSVCTTCFSFTVQALIISDWLNYATTGAWFHRIMSHFSYALQYSIAVSPLQHSSPALQSRTPVQDSSPGLQSTECRYPSTPVQHSSPLNADTRSLPMQVPLRGLTAGVRLLAVTEGHGHHARTRHGDG